MKFKLILLFGILMLSLTKSEGNENLKMLHAVYQKDIVLSKDTLKDEFDLKKKSVANLIKGQSAEHRLTFYEFYLQGKDQLRADSLIQEILKSENSVDYRHKISLISYRYTSDTKAAMLFLSDPDRIKEYRTYFLKYTSSSLKSNADFWAHYYDFVALDAAYYKIAPDSLVRKQMSHHYNSLAWYSIITQKLDGVENYINESIKYDPQYKYPYSNLPLVLLLKGRYEEARTLYVKFKDQPFDTPTSTFKDEFLEDFKELAAVGITNKDIKKITALLNSKSTE